MPDVKTTTEREMEILRENHIEKPEKFGVMARGDDFIRLLCYDTRCVLTINKGDKPW